MYPFAQRSFLSHVTPSSRVSANDPAMRKKYVKLVESVRRKGSEVLIFSSMHESGQRESFRFLFSTSPSYIAYLLLSGLLLFSRNRAEPVNGSRGYSDVPP